MKTVLHYLRVHCNTILYYCILYMEIVTISICTVTIENRIGETYVIQMKRVRRGIKCNRALSDTVFH